MGEDHEPIPRPDRHSGVKGQAEPIPVGEQNGYDLQIAEFMQSLKDGTEPPTANLASSLLSATIAEAERESIAQGRRIDLSI